MTINENRILGAIANVDEVIKDLPPDKQEKLVEATQLDLGDWLALGEWPSRALASGRINADEANTLHDIHTRFTKASIAERAVFMQTIAELAR
jgi:hypothetical protein